MASIGRIQRGLCEHRCGHGGRRARVGLMGWDVSMLLVGAGQSGLCIYDERVPRISAGHRCRSRALPFVVRM